MAQVMSQLRGIDRNPMHGKQRRECDKAAISGRAYTVFGFRRTPHRLPVISPKRHYRPINNSGGIIPSRHEGATTSSFFGLVLHGRRDRSTAIRAIQCESGDRPHSRLTTLLPSGVDRERFTVHPQLAPYRRNSRSLFGLKRFPVFALGNLRIGWRNTAGFQASADAGGSRVWQISLQNAQKQAIQNESYALRTAPRTKWLCQSCVAGVTWRGQVAWMPRKSRAKPPSPFKGFNSSPEVIRLVVLMSVGFPLSLRNVEDLLFERGIDLCHETVRYWWNRFAPLFAADIRRQRISREDSRQGRSSGAHEEGAEAARLARGDHHRWSPLLQGGDDRTR